MTELKRMQVVTYRDARGRRVRGVVKTPNVKMPGSKERGVAVVPLDHPIYMSPSLIEDCP